MASELKDFSEMLDRLGKVAQLNFAWHFVSLEWKDRVLSAQTEHCCNFCMKIKRENSRLLLRRCIREHHEQEFLQALKLRKPFVIRCHAGAMELAMPIFIREEFIGVLCAGTFHAPDSRGYPEYESERQKLPAIPVETLLAWGELIENLAEKFLPEMLESSDREPLLHPMLCHDTRILRSVILLRSNLKRRVSVKEAAREAGMCPSRFLHLFPKETGYSFSDFMQRLRVEYARKLVEGSDLMLGEIAERCGIQSQSRMSVLFHRYLGMSPRELRKHFRGVILKNSQRKMDDMARPPRLPH